MTQPAQPDDPVSQPGPGPDSGEPAEPPPAADQAADETRELRASLAAERKKSIALERQVAELQKKNMTDTEKAITEAREEGRAQAIREAASRVAAAEFRTLAQGRLGDADAALEMLDLSRFVNDDGEPDRDALKAVIERLVPPSAAPKVPAGPHTARAGESDFIRARLAARRG